MVNIEKVGFKYKVAKIMYLLSTLIDNSGISNFNKNGEEKFIHELFSNLKTKTQITLFDVGGNVGNYTQMLFEGARKTNQNFRIHVFEPTQYCYHKLSNRFDDNRISKNKLACSDSSGWGKIYYDTKGSEQASMYNRNLYNRNLEMYNNTLNIKERVNTKRLDEYIEENDINHIDFIKVDVEGNEMRVFTGMGKYLNCDFVDYIQFEYGRTNLNSMTSLMDFYEFFESKGFVLAKVMPSGLQIRKYEPFLEIFEYSNYAAISKMVI